MVRNIERHDNDDQYSNSKLAKYKKMIEYSKKSFYHGYPTQYMRLFVMMKLFLLKVSNEWGDYSFKDLLTLLKDILPQDNTILETVYETKQIICRLGLEVKKITRATIIVFYIMGLSTKTSRNALFVDSTNSIIEKMVVMMRTTTEIGEKAGLKIYFGTFLSFLV
jgi:hypothetical protein